MRKIMETRSLLSNTIKDTSTITHNLLLNLFLLVNDPHNIISYALHRVAMHVLCIMCHVPYHAVHTPYDILNKQND